MAFLLHQLAQEFKTDKAHHEHNYVTMYTDIMEKTRFTTKKILEIGFGNGGSIKMWQEYFPFAEVWCMEDKGKEYEEVWKKPLLELPKLHLVIGDSTLPETWKDVPNDFDYIIDDGSHFPNDQIATFVSAFPKLKSHGYYFIEDTHCGFEERYGATSNLYDWVFAFVKNQQTPGKNYGGNFYQARDAMEGYAKDIFSYRFYKSVIVFEKA